MSLKHNRDHRRSGLVRNCLRDCGLNGRLPAAPRAPHRAPGKGSAGALAPLALFCAGVLSGLTLAPAGALGEDIPAGENLYPYAGSATSGTIWNLQGNTYLSDGATTSLAVNLPSGLTISGAPGGSSITMNDGANHFTSIRLASGGTLNLSDVTLTGGNSTTDGGIIRSSGNLTITGAGALAFTDSKTATNSGAAIYNVGTTTITGYDTLVFDHLTAASGSAINGSGLITLQAGAVELTNNTTSSNGAIYSRAGGVTIDGGVITMTGNGGNGITAIQASGGDVSIGNTGSIVTVSDNIGNASAIYTGPTGGGAITILGRRIEVNGNQAKTQFGGALYAGAGESVSIGNADGSTDSVQVNGNSAGGVGYGAIYTAGITINGNQVQVNDNHATTGMIGAIASHGAVSIGNADSTAVEIIGNTAATAVGAIYSTSGDVTISGRKITLADNSSNGSYGAIIASGNVLIGDADSTDTVALTGNRAAGGSVGAIYSAGSVTINGHEITVADNSATGNAGAIYSLGSVTLTGAGTVTGNTAGGRGGAIWAGGNVTLNATNGDITFSGNTAGGQANAIWFENATASLNTLDSSILDDPADPYSKGFVTTPTENPSTRVAGGATATFSAAAGQTITFFDPIANNADNGLLTVAATGPGAVVFDGSKNANESQVYAATTVWNGIFGVRNGAVYGVLAADAGQLDPTSFMVNSGATLAGGIQGEVRADAFTLGGTLDISGSTALGHPAGTAAGGYSNFIITGTDVRFAPGSQILFNTYLNDGGTQLTDMLTLNLNGGATSGTASVIVANTGGLGGQTIGNGIQLVQTNNGASTGAFTLGNEVAAGAYEYALYQGGIGADADDGNWYLRSEGFRPEVSVDTATPALAVNMSLAMLGTFFDRNGATQFYGNDLEANKAQPADIQYARRTWGRVLGETGSWGSNGPTYDFTFGGVQAGGDLYRAGRDNAGLFISASRMRATIEGQNGSDAGKVSMNAYAIGGYWTHRHPDGWYTDLVLQGARYENIDATTYGGQTTSTSGFGLAASAEAGWRLALGAGYDLAPQAQIVYQHTSLDDASDAFSRIKFDSTDELYGRLGCRLAKGWTTERGKAITTWAETNVWHRFAGDAETTFTNPQGENPTTIATSLNDTWGQLGIGVSGQVTSNVILFANGNYNLGLSRTGHSLGGLVGLKISW